MPEEDLPVSQQPSTEETLSQEGGETPINQSPITATPEGEAIKNKLDFDDFLETAIKELKSRRKDLLIEIEELTKKKAFLEKEINKSFSGQSDAIARRVKGFQEYLTGALQDLAQSAEKLELVAQPVLVQPSPLDQNISKPEEEKEETISNMPISETFKPDEALIRECLEQFLGQPDFYAEPWKLRRSLSNKDNELLEDWFFSQGGRGAQPSRGNRVRNTLVGAAVISILGELYGDRFQTLVLASQPERLGEWRRGLQDALGLGREDFGPSSGIVLFERGDALVERADRLEDKGEVPLIIVDAAEQVVEIPLLQFPIWLAFAASQEEIYAEEEEFLR